MHYLEVSEIGVTIIDYVVYTSYSTMFSCRNFMIIEQAPILGGWKTCQRLSFKHFTKEAVQGNNQVYCNTDNPSKVCVCVCVCVLC